MAAQDDTNREALASEKTIPAPLAAGGAARRRFGLGVSGVLVTLASQPAMADVVCGTWSASLSKTHASHAPAAQSLCLGRSPDFWRDNPAAWSAAGTAPGSMFNTHFATSGMGSELAPYTLMEVLTPSALTGTGNTSNTSNSNSGNGNGNGNNGNNGNGNNGNNGNGNNGNGNNGNNGNGNGNNGNGNGNGNNGNLASGGSKDKGFTTVLPTGKETAVDKERATVAAYFVATLLNVRSNRVSFLTEESVLAAWKSYATTSTFTPMPGAAPWTGPDLVVYLNSTMQDGK